MSKKGQIKVTQEEIAELYEPDKFYNYGDNPAFKKFMEITSQNQMEGKQIDQRTYVVDKRTKFFWARNWDDFLQRDLKCTNFVRAGAVWAAFSAYGLVVALQYRKFLPIGIQGITKITQTSFFYNFGYLGIISLHAYTFGWAYMYWKTTKFTLDKFYKHCLLGERNWLYEFYRQQPGVGLYYFKDDPLSCEENFPDLARLEMAKGKWPVPEWEKK